MMQKLMLCKLGKWNSWYMWLLGPTNLCAGTDLFLLAILCYPHHSTRWMQGERVMNGSFNWLCDHRLFLRQKNARRVLLYTFLPVTKSLLFTHQFNLNNLCLPVLSPSIIESRVHSSTIKSAVWCEWERENLHAVAVRPFFTTPFTLWHWFRLHRINKRWISVLFSIIRKMNYSIQKS